MSGLEIAFGIVLLVFAVGIIAIVLLQEGQQRNTGVITGGSSDTFLSKHQGRSIDAFLARWTRIISVGFFIFVIVVNIVLFFSPGQANAGGDVSSSGSVSAISESSEAAGDSDAVVSGLEPENAESSAAAVVSQAPEASSVESAASEPAASTESNA